MTRIPFAWPAPPLLPVHLGTHCITKISPTILPDTIINSVTAFGPKRSVIHKGHGAWRTWKESRHLASEISTVQIFFFGTKIVTKMRFYSGTATNQYNSAEHGCIIYPGASLQHTLVPLPYTIPICTNLKRALNLECTRIDCGLPGRGCDRVGQHTNTWCPRVCPAKR